MPETSAALVPQAAVDAIFGLLRDITSGQAKTTPQSVRDRLADRLLGSLN